MELDPSSSTLNHWLTHSLQCVNLLEPPFCHRLCFTDAYLSICLTAILNLQILPLHIVCYMTSQDQPCTYISFFGFFPSKFPSLSHFVSELTWVHSKLTEKSNPELYQDTVGKFLESWHLLLIAVVCIFNSQKNSFFGVFLFSLLNTLPINLANWPMRLLKGRFDAQDYLLWLGTTSTTRKSRPWLSLRSAHEFRQCDQGALILYWYCMLVSLAFAFHKLPLSAKRRGDKGYSQCKA